MSEVRQVERISLVTGNTQEPEIQMASENRIRLVWWQISGSKPQTYGCDPASLACASAPEPIHAATFDPQAVAPPNLIAQSIRTAPVQRRPDAGGKRAAGNAPGPWQR